MFMVLFSYWTVENVKNLTKRLDKKDELIFTKMLSDYMLYLLVKQFKMLSYVAGIVKIRFRDTYAEAIKFFNMRGLDPEKPTKVKVKRACRSIYKVNTGLEPIVVKGVGSKFVLFDACILAKKLEKLEELGKNKWHNMCKYGSSFFLMGRATAGLIPMLNC
ncbi:hypothetical protein SAY87_022362 [Trapa incisa]|uniref:Uncharacterized protein n=1 Tax=Trapa incisa TaxID=236973 RepID=A0AAN7K6X3_9MYRT|nr:hypothetical protein SAY87_022362 [Trapa incisa]